MNILYVTFSDPRETSDGARQRTRLLWESLKSLGNVYCAVMHYSGMPAIDAPEERIKSVEVYPYGWPWGKLRSLIYNHFYKPTVWPFTSPFLRLSPWKDVKFDLAVCRYPESVWASRAWKIAPAVVDVDDWPPDAHESIWAKKYWPWWRPWARRVVWWWTRGAISKCRAAWIANRDHAKLLAPFGIPCEFLPNLATAPKNEISQDLQNPNLNQQNATHSADSFLDPVNPVKSPGQYLVTVGLMSHPPNYEGVDRFLAEHWPAVRAKFPQLEYRIAGRAAPPDCVRRWSAIDGVRVLGFVEDLDALYAGAAAVVAPVYSGSGTCIKVLEAAAHGKVVFAAEEAMRGYDSDARKKLGMQPIGRIPDMLGAITRALEEAIAREAAKINSREFFDAQVAKLVRTTVR